jgi:hypothetical protein
MPQIPQLVNKLCVHCEQRISSILDAEFCEECANPVHHDCKRTGDPSIGECSNCGAPQAVATTKQPVEGRKVLQVFDGSNKHSPYIGIHMEDIDFAFRHTRTSQPSPISFILRVGIGGIAFVFGWIFAAMGVLHVIRLYSIPYWDSMKWSIVGIFLFASLSYLFVKKIGLYLMRPVPNSYHLMVVFKGEASSVLTSDDATCIDRLVDSIREVKGPDWEESKSVDETPHVRLGRCVRYPVSYLQRWIDQQKKGGEAE